MLWCLGRAYLRAAAFAGRARLTGSLEGIGAALLLHDYSVATAAVAEMFRSSNGSSASGASVLSPLVSSVASSTTFTSSAYRRYPSWEVQLLPVLPVPKHRQVL